MDKTARVNLSKLIAEKLKNDITKGESKPGDRLPPHEEICEKWGVSRGTLREALKKPETEGIVEIHQRRETFVCKPREEIFGNAFMYNRYLDRKLSLHFSK